MAESFDEVRPPSMKRRRGGKKKKRRGRVGGPGSVVPEPEFSSYYGRQVVKAPPWENPIAVYLVLGGIAGGSSLLGAGAQLTGNDRLRASTRLTAIGAAGAGSVALIMDLGRPERFLNMLRVFKLSSPMSVGAWILSGFASAAGLAAAGEGDELTGRRLPIPRFARRLLHAATPVAGLGAAALGAPLAVYTAVLLSDTSVPTWNAAKDHLPFVFVSSASLAAGGAAMITTPNDAARPARLLAAAGAAGDVAAMRALEKGMDPVAQEPLHHGKPGKWLKWSERLVVAGGIGALVSRRSRLLQAASGAALVAGSALTRFAVLHAGLESAKNPRYTVEPQKRRLEERRSKGEVGDSVTTAR